MTHPPAFRNYSEQQAGSLRAGDHLILPDGNRSAEVHRVDVESDDFGTPAMVLATLSGGGVLRIAAGSTVRLAGDAEPGADTPESAELGPADTSLADAASAASDGDSSGGASSDGESSGARAPRSTTPRPTAVRPRRRCRARSPNPTRRCPTQFCPTSDQFCPTRRGPPSSFLPSPLPRPR